MIQFPLVVLEVRGLFLKPDELSNYSYALTQSGFNYLKDNGFGIEPNCDIFFKAPELTTQEGPIQNSQFQLDIVSEGMYVYSSRMPTQLLAMTSNNSSIEYISLSFWDEYTFKNLLLIYQNNLNGSHPHRSLVESPLLRNFKVLRNTFTAVNNIDINLTDIGFGLNGEYEEPLIAFIILLNHLGYGVTFTVNADTNTETNAGTNADTFAKFFYKLINAINSEIEDAIARSTSNNTQTIKGLSLYVVKAVMIRNVSLNRPEFNLRHWAKEVKKQMDLLNAKIRFLQGPLNKPLTTNGFFVPDFQVTKTTTNPAKLQPLVTDLVVQNPLPIAGIGIGTYDRMLLLRLTQYSLAELSNAILPGLDEISLTYANSTTYTFTFTPVVGKSFPLSEGLHIISLCSSIFTLSSASLPSLPTLTLQVSPPASVKFFPPTKGPVIGWEEKSNGVFTNTGNPSVSITITYTPGSLSIIVV